MAATAGVGAFVVALLGYNAFISKVEPVASPKPEIASDAELLDDSTPLERLKKKGWKPQVEAPAAWVEPTPAPSVTRQTPPPSTTNETGTQADVAEAEEAVIRTMKDPDSAIFGEMTYVDKDHACLTVNGKNTFGGYTGDQQAYLKRINGSWVSQFIHEGPKSICLEVNRREA